MQIKASLKNLRTSPKKVKLVIDLIRGKNVQEAEQQLSFLNKGSAKDILKLVNSATANAENNLNLQKSNLFIKEIMVGGGVTVKRWNPRAFGRAGLIRKKTSHIKITLEEKIPTSLDKIKKNKIESKVIKISDLKDKIVKDKVDIKGKKQGGPSDGKSGGGKGFTKKMFQRKAG